MTEVKICGITNIEDALAAAQAGADALGFVFAPSPRRLSPAAARAIINHLPASIQKIGVFVDETRECIVEIARCCQLDWLQLHGSETAAACAGLPLPVIKAFKVRGGAGLEEIQAYRGRVARILLDTFDPHRFGGTGRMFDWRLAGETKNLGPLVIAGGLTPENVCDAITAFSPVVVDVSSGVEHRPGKKDHTMMAAFIANVRAQGMQERESAANVPCARTARAAGR